MAAFPVFCVLQLLSCALRALRANFGILAAFFSAFQGVDHHLFEDSMCGRFPLERIHPACTQALLFRRGYGDGEADCLASVGRQQVQIILKATGELFFHGCLLCLVRRKDRFDDRRTAGRIWDNPFVFTYCCWACTVLHPEKPLTESDSCHVQKSCRALVPYTSPPVSLRN